MLNKSKNNINFYAVVESVNNIDDKTQMKCFVGKGSAIVNSEVSVLLSDETIINTHISNVNIEHKESKVILTLPTLVNVSIGDIIVNGKNDVESIKLLKAKILLPYLYSQDNQQIKQAATDSVITSDYFSYVENKDSNDLDEEFKVLYSPDNEAYLPIFTSLDEPTNTSISSNSKSVIFPFSKYIESVFLSESIKGVVINPFTDNVICHQGYLAFLKYLAESKRIGGSKLSVGLGGVISFAACDTNQEIKNFVSEYCDKNKNIGTAWLCQFQYNSNQSILLVLDIHGDSEEVIINLGNKIKEIIPNMYLDIVDNKSIEIQKGIRNIEPFYRGGTLYETSY